MSFNFDQWKASTKEKLQGWKIRMGNAGLNSAYYFLAGVSLWPVAQAVHGGDWSGLAVLGATVGSAVSTNLLANIVQKAKDKSDVEVAQLLQEEIRTSPELKAEIEVVLQKLNTLQEAEKALLKEDKAWFEKLIQRELKQLNSGIKYEATLTGSGAIVQGDGATAVGAGGIFVGGNVNNANIDNRKIESKTYIETQVIEFPNPEAEKKAKAREKYLNRLSRVCLSLPLVALGGGDGDESDITLDKIYIGLNATEPYKADDSDDESRLKEQKNLINRLIHRITPQLLPIQESVKKFKRLVILGDPGAGKSTFVKNLIAWQAGLLLGKLQDANGIEDDLLPALIILRDLTPRLANVEIDSLPANQRDAKLTQIVWEHMQADLGEECADFREGLSEALHNGKCLLVLDGLDEVPHDLRVRVRQAVDALFKQYHLQRAIITCRVRSYVGETILPSFESRTLAPFDEEQIKNFVEHWYITQRTLGKFNEEQAKDRMDDLSNAALEDDMQELSSNPMLLTTMAIIHQREVGLPRERVRLYQQAVEVLLRRWQKHKVGDAALADFLKNDLKLRAVMEALAYEAHRASTKESGTGSLLRKDALDLLEGDNLLGDMHLAVEFLDYVDQRAGLLVGYGGELNKPTAYSFPHRTFQEYLAGAYLARQRDRVRTFYEHAAEGDIWDLTAKLAFEELYYNRRSENELLDLAYQLDKPGGTGEQSERARLWAGQIITIVGKEVAERDTHPNGGNAYLSRLILGLVPVLASNSLPPLERAETGRILAQLGDPREEVMTIDKMTFCRIPAGEFIMGEGEDQNKVTLPEYFISQYAITNAQFDHFVKAECYKQEKYWTEAKQNRYWSEAGFKGRWDNEPRIAQVNSGFPFTHVNHPVVNVTWYEALAFTRWLNEQIQQVGQFHVFNEKSLELFRNKWQVTLPNEAEWEKAARGTDGRTYPWGEEANLNCANTDATGIQSTSAVGCFSQGVSLYGLQDVSGNVWEWMRNDYMSGKDDFQSREDKGIRGGSFGSQSDRAYCASRAGLNPFDYASSGFRVVVSPALPS